MRNDHSPESWPAAYADRSGRVHAVRNVTLEARPGRVTGLVGPNGSGKTTLLLMLSSLLAPDAGEITVGGVDPMTDPQGARAILGWMPDSSAHGARSPRGRRSCSRAGCTGCRSPRHPRVP